MRSTGPDRRRSGRCPDRDDRRTWRDIAAVACATLLSVVAIAPVRAVDLACVPFSAPPPSAQACAALPADVSRLQLVERTLSALDTSRLEIAERTLDCLDARLGADAVWRDRYDAVRLRGNLLFERKQLQAALPRYECALAIARAARDPEAIAKAYNNIGTLWGQLGDDQQALRALSDSLRTRAVAGIPPSGKNLMNLADLYARIRDDDRALQTYEQAYAVFAAAGDHRQMGHVREGMGALAADRGRTTQARGWLMDALRHYAEVDGDADWLLGMTYADLARNARRIGDHADARMWVARGLALSDRPSTTPQPAPLLIEAAELDLRDGMPASAMQRLRPALARLAPMARERFDVLVVLARAHAAAGDAGAAYAAQREAQKIADTLYAEAQSRRSNTLRFRIERDRTVAQLEARNRRQARLWWSAAGMAVLSALVVAAALWRRRWRRRLDAVARRARHEAEIERYRRLADELRFDRRILQASLDSRDDALCILDANGGVLAANAAAGHALGIAADGMIGSPIVESLAPTAQAGFLAAFDRLDDGDERPFAFTAIRAGTTGEARLSPWREDSGVVLMTLTAGSASTVPPPDVVAGDATVDARHAEVRHVEARHVEARDTGADALREAFRAALVELMLVAAQSWERATGLNRIELAERSRLWRVTVDDGRLRARTMDRYFSLAKLPRHPHWREVLRTAYFVLGQEALDDGMRAELQARVDTVLAYTRRSALV